MLKFISINPSGMFSYGVSETINLDNLGLVHLIGVNEDRDSDSNGSGKSSLFNALCEIVWGENPTGVSGAGVCNANLKKGFCGRVEFISDNQHYRVTYTRDWKDEFYPVDSDNGVVYQGTMIGFEAFQDGLWRDLRGSSMKESRESIQKALGLTYERFLASSYLSPRTGNLLLKGSNKDRMDLMSGIVGLSSWDRILDNSRETKRGIQSRSIEVEKKLSYLEGSYSELVRERDNVASTDWNATISQHEDYVKSLQVQEGDLIKKQEEVFNQLQEANAKKAKDSKTIRTSIATIKREINLLEGREREPINDTQDIRSLNSTIRGMEGEISVLEGKLRSYKSKDGVTLSLDACPTCKSKENWDSIKNSIIVQQKSLEDEIEEVNKRLIYSRDILNGLVDAQKRVREEYIKEGREKASSLWAEVRALEEEAKEVDKVSSTIDQQISQLTAKNRELNSQVMQVRGEISQSLARIENYRSMLVKLGELGEKVNSKSQEMAEVQVCLDELKDEGLYFDWLIKHAPFIKLHKLSVSLVELSDIVNKYLGDIGESIRVSISSFSNKKGKSKGPLADSLKSEIELSITDGDKAIDPHLYSDGETGRVSLAISRALHDMAVARGSGCNLMFLDEVFSYVDHSSAQKMGGLFNLIGDTVVVTDNSGRATDLLNFSTVWVARKKNGVTQLEA
jgi:DNA repair exonuclease SbcCD ATPase subunit